MVKYHIVHYENVARREGIAFDGLTRWLVLLYATSLRAKARLPVESAAARLDDDDEVALLELDQTYCRTPPRISMSAPTVSSQGGHID
jgi:hypothetical protein